MKQVLLAPIYLGLAFGFGLLAKKVSVGFLWPCVSHAAFGVAYLLDDPRVTAKNTKTGKIPLWNLILMGPLYLELWTVWALRAYIHNKEPVWEEICEGVYVGRFPFLFGFQVQLEEDIGGQKKADTRRQIDSKKAPFPPHVGLIVDITCEFVEVDALLRNKSYICLPSLDSSFCPDDDLVLEKLLYAYQWDLQKGGIYIHCAAGHGRSVLFLGMLMVLKGVAADLPDALTKIRKNRPVCRWNQTHRDAGARILPRAMEQLKKKNIGSGSAWTLK